MRTILVIMILYVGVTSCSSRQTNEEKENNLIQELNVNKTNKNKDLIGVWWNVNDKDAPTATFMITDSTIVYPDQEGKSDYKYKINNDSLTIYYAGYFSTSKIEKLTKDTLILITDGDKMTLYKTKE
jgi:hypothetical protein